MVKKILICTLLLLGFATESNVHAVSFELRCFIDNFSIPGTVSLATALFSVYYLHESITAFINKKPTDVNQQQVPANTMLEKAKNYGRASAAMAAISLLFYFRQPIKTVFSAIPRLFHR